MKRYCLKVSYDGTQYSGWQIQPNAPSIQESLQKALSTILQAPITIFGSGRTDRGVHAKGQVAHFETADSLDEKRVLLSLNGLLPSDIRVYKLFETDLDFHARFSARGKIYHYHFWDLPVVDPINSAYRLHMRNPLCVELLKQACCHFVGYKDFTTFANHRVSNQVIANPFRNLKRLELVKQEGGFRLEFEGDGFLYKMVRNIVGVLIEIGQKRRSMDSLEALFASRNRRAIGMPAPAHGLFLHRVIY